MGYGSYTAQDWAKLKTSRRLETATTTQIFSRRSCDPKFDPKYVGFRESRDSQDHPASLPIMIGVDVTGSMGYLSTQIIKESLNDLMQALYASSYLKDPQLLFAAIGDVKDVAPLQVTQFESDIRIAEQMMNLWLEGGGFDAPEDYELLWYFAAKHTLTDCAQKRQEKGFCFTIGDAGCHEKLSKEAIGRIFADTPGRGYTSEALARMAGESYEVFHVMIGNNPGNLAQILPGRVLLVARSEIRFLPEILISVMQLVRGEKKETVLSQWGALSRPVVKKALAFVVVEDGKKISF